MISASNLITYLTTVVILTTSCSISAQDNIQGKVVGVSDGDTITLLTADHIQYKIRLTGIDAPEKKQRYGIESKEALSECAYDKDATIDGNKKDRYGRVVGKVLVNGVDCNLRQIQLGLAWHYKKYQNEQEVEDRSRYAQEEYVAQSLKKGLWSSKESIPPWDYRKLKKEKYL